MHGDSGLLTNVDPSPAGYPLLGSAEVKLERLDVTAVDTVFDVYFGGARATANEIARSGPEPVKAPAVSGPEPVKAPAGSGPEPVKAPAGTGGPRRGGGPRASGGTSGSSSVDRKFRCTECDRLFRWKSHLTRHRRIHLGEKPFQCMYCGASFRRKHHLTTHQRIHTGEKPYPCQTCGAHFRQKATLVAHWRTHKR